ncbi:predicted protein [Arabidopsis lyrata subsp. lyrata]|uniref:Predicted protein n=1 Tax=Arabidopsis lyrata subsp. lyrata TaxID=81972 RepID=D7M8F6_ARALL|nr:predicted protein [Arabidopsis lyrata subsp. lyrata]
MSGLNPVVLLRFRYGCCSVWEDLVAILAVLAFSCLDLVLSFGDSGFDLGIRDISLQAGSVQMLLWSHPVRAHKIWRGRDLFSGFAVLILELNMEELQISVCLGTEFWVKGMGCVWWKLTEEFKFYSERRSRGSMEIEYLVLNVRDIFMEFIFSGKVRTKSGYSRSELFFRWASGVIPVYVRGSLRNKFRRVRLRKAGLTLMWWQRKELCQLMVEMSRFWVSVLYPNQEGIKWYTDPQFWNVGKSISGNRGWRFCLIIGEGFSKRIKLNVLFSRRFAWWGRRRWLLGNDISVAILSDQKRNVIRLDVYGSVVAFFAEEAQRGNNYDQGFNSGCGILILIHRELRAMGKSWEIHLLAISDLRGMLDAISRVFNNCQAFAYFVVVGFNNSRILHALFSKTVNPRNQGMAKGTVGGGKPPKYKGDK